MGTTTLPLDLDIFFRSGSTTKPEMVAVRHGRQECSRWDRTTRLNSQVLMMSCASGAMSIGKVRLHNCSSRDQPHAICGVSELVAQVSITSGSAVKPPG